MEDKDKPIYKGMRPITMEDIDNAMKELNIKDWPIKYHGDSIEINGTFMSKEIFHEAMRKEAEKYGKA